MHAARKHDPVADWAADLGTHRAGDDQHAPTRCGTSSDPAVPRWAPTERSAGAWYPVANADVSAIAHDTALQSESVLVNDFKTDGTRRPQGLAPRSPPTRPATARRAALLPAFSPA